jgi:hypothetical protein
MTDRQKLNNRFVQVFNALEAKGLIVKSARDEKSKGRFALKLDTKSHIIDKYLRGERYITYEQTKKLCREYSISELFMHQGIGDMFQEESLQIVEGNVAPNDLLPHLNAEANPKPLPGFKETPTGYATIKMAATHAIGLSDKFLEDQLETFNIPGVSGNYVAFYVKGNSMEPHIMNGDMVICQALDTKDRIVDNRVYAVVTSDGFMVKRIQKIYNDKGSFTHLNLISDNYLEHAPFKVEVRDVIQVLEVKRRLTDMSQ